MLELKHVSLYKGLADLLIGPGDEEFVVVIGFLRQPGGEINGCFQIHSLPVKVNNWQLDTVLCQYTVSISILTEYIMLIKVSSSNFTSSPECFQQNTEFLCSSQSKHWNQDLKQRHQIEQDINTHV